MGLGKIYSGSNSWLISRSLPASKAVNANKTMDSFQRQVAALKCGWQGVARPETNTSKPFSE